MTDILGLIEQNESKKVHCLVSGPLECQEPPGIERVPQKWGQNGPYNRPKWAIFLNRVPDGLHKSSTIDLPARESYAKKSNRLMIAKSKQSLFKRQRMK